MVKEGKKEERKERKYHLQKERERKSDYFCWEERRADLRTFDLGFKRKVAFPMLGVGGKQRLPVRGNDRWRKAQFTE